MTLNYHKIKKTDTMGQNCTKTKISKTVEEHSNYTKRKKTENNSKAKKRLKPKL